MAHPYQALQKWQHWLLKEPLGAYLSIEEARVLKQLIHAHYGKYALLVGVPAQTSLLTAATYPFSVLFSPLIPDTMMHAYVEGDLHRLPFQTASLDLVILPHTLELVENARQLLAEICRVVKPEGMIVIFGFNPYSFSRIASLLRNKNSAPHHASLIRLNAVKDWLRLADFDIDGAQTFFIHSPSFLFISERVWRWFGKILSAIFPKFGTVYVVSARAKILPLTPIRLKWTQKLTGIAFPASLPGNFAKRQRES